MRVTENRNPHAYQPSATTPAAHARQRPHGSGKEFADAFVRTAEQGQRHGKPEPEKNGNPSKYPDIAELNLRRSSIHSFSGTQIKLTAEQLVPVKEDEEPVFGTLQYYDGSNDAVAIKIIPDPPTYPGSIHNMNYSDLRKALGAVFFASCFDTSGMTNEEHYNQISGMTREDLYNQMKGLYQTYLGEDFLEVSRQRASDTHNSDSAVYREVIAQFYDDLRSFNIHNLETEEIMKLKEDGVDALDKLTEKLLSERVPPSNPRSIYDMQNPDKVAALRTVSLQARTGGNIGDAEGLSREEIFERLEAVYSSYFGKDFLNGGVETRGQGGIYDNIYLQFFDELKQYNVHSTSTDAILGLRSYSVQALDDTWLNR